MKYFVTILFLLIFTSFLFGTTFHTITIDGTNDFSSDETFTTTSTGYTTYITWDQNNLYIGYEGADINAGINPQYKWILIYFDTDPQTTPTSGTGTTVGQLYNTQQPNLPFSANFHFRWKGDNSYTNMGKWTGSSWDYGAGSGYWSGSHVRSGTYIEFSFPLSDLGNPSQLYICTNMINEEAGFEWTYAGNPNDMFSDGYDPDYLHYYGFNLTSGISPNQAQYHDNSLPVTLSSFSVQIKLNTFILQWITESEVDVLGYEIQRATNQAGPFQTIASYQDHSELRAVGNTSAQTVYSFEDQTVSPGVTYWYKLISHDLDGSQQTFGPVSATLQNNNDQLQPVSGNIPDQFELKQNFPNPFNNTTEIVFTLPQEQNRVQLKIYDLNGKLIKTLVNSDLGAGKYQLRWNGDDNLGHLVPSGVYIYQLSTPQFVHSKKMLLIQ